MVEQRGFFRLPLFAAFFFGLDRDGVCFLLLLATCFDRWSSRFPDVYRMNGQIGTIDTLPLLSFNM